MITFTILGEAASKANSRRLVTFGKRPASIKSTKALMFERSALLQIPAEAKQMLEGDIKATIKLYYSTCRPDLDESIVLDILQAKFKGSGKNRECVRRGVYLNDRQVKEKHIYHGIDKQNPRTEIEIMVI
jgi:Holliday junction resolvase RusA-like endonuclease